VASTLRTPICRELGIGCRVLGGSVVTEIKLAAQIVRDLAREAEIALRRPVPT
jgi:hypothetical protein